MGCKREVVDLPELPEGVWLLCPPCKGGDGRRRYYVLGIQWVRTQIEGSNPEAWEFESAIRRVQADISARQRQIIYEIELLQYPHIPGIPDDVARACFLHYQGEGLREIQTEMGLANHMQVDKLLKDGKARHRELLRKHGGRYGKYEMAREELGLGPDPRRMDRRALLNERCALRDINYKPAPDEKGRRLPRFPSMGDAEEKSK